MHRNISSHPSEATPGVRPSRPTARFTGSFSPDIQTSVSDPVLHGKASKLRFTSELPTDYNQRCAAAARLRRGFEVSSDIERLYSSWPCAVSRQHVVPSPLRRYWCLDVDEPDSVCV